MKNPLEVYSIVDFKGEQLAKDLVQFGSDTSSIFALSEFPSDLAPGIYRWDGEVRRALSSDWEDDVRYDGVVKHLRSFSFTLAA